MTVSPPAEIHSEMFPPVLPQGRIKSMAHGRTLIGRFAEEIVIATLGLRPCHQSGNYDVCFDAESGEGERCEIKVPSCREAAHRLSLEAGEGNLISGGEVSHPAASSLLGRDQDDGGVGPVLVGVLRGAVEHPGASPRSQDRRGRASE